MRSIEKCKNIKENVRKGRRWIHPFKGGKPVHHTYIVFDTETLPIKREDMTEHRLRYGYAQHIHKGNLKADKEFSQKRDFTRWLLSRLKHGHQTLTVWGHNVSFDVRTALDFNYVNSLGWNYVPVSVKPFILKLWRDRQRIVFLDTFSYYQTRLQKLGSYLNLSKHVIQDFRVADNESIRRRCIRDVQITSEIVKHLFNFMQHRVSCSLPQLGFKLMRQVLPHAVQCINGLSEESYYGGRCELFKRSREANAVLLDFNSMHPSAMLNPLPMKKLDHEHNPSIKDVMGLIENGYGVTAKVRVDVPQQYVPPFPLRRADNKIIFPTGRYDTVLNSPEIALAPDLIEYASEIDVYEMRPFLKPFVETYYAKRLNANSQIDKEFYKLLLNAVYGKFGQKIKVTREVDHTDFVLPDSHYTGVVDCFMLDGSQQELKVFNGKAYAQEEAGRAYSTAVSSYICSYARAMLYQAMIKAGEDLIYCDTDSVVIRERALPWYQNQIGPELGQLKLERRGQFKGYRPKMYEFAGNLKCKGVPRQAKVTFNHTNATTSFERFIGLTEGIRRFHTGKVGQILVDKQISLADDKRIWHGDESTPIRL